MSNLRTAKSGRTAPKRGPRPLILVAYGVVACVGLIMLIVGLRAPAPGVGAGPAGSSRPSLAESTAAADRPKAATASKVSSQPTDDNLIDDDGKTLWASPTDGRPIDVAYLPPGVKFILAIRPESIAEHPEGDKILEAGKPWMTRAWDVLANDLPGITGVERAVMGFGVDGKGEWSVSAVVHLSAGETAAAYIADNRSKAIEKSHLVQPTSTAVDDQRYWIVGDRAYFAPKGDAQVLVVATPEAMTEIIDLAGDPPPLRRDVERLLAITDADRFVTLVVTPNSLFSEGRNLFEGEMPRLREPLFWFLGDELSAAALSLHWDENFFYELSATPTLETSPELAARILSERLREAPEKVKLYVGTLELSAYGKEVVSRFPAMLEKLATYSRSGFDADHASLRGYLPAVAGHNLLMAAELTLAESPGVARTVADFDKLSPGEATSPSESAAAGQKSVEERLQRLTSLRFGRDTLEAALDQLSKDIRVAIVIRGPDLQADGITKNQQFGIDLENKPAEQILVEILRLANPDKTATGPNDEKQKLVYVILPGENGSEQIVVTTRAAAATRGDELPAAFKVAKP